MGLRRKTSVGIYTISDMEAKCVPQDDGCMIWSGGVSKHRGAIMWLPKLKMSVSATQAFEQLKSTPLEPGKRWRPMCGNVMCCANAHRVQMTTSEWMKLIRPTLSPVHRARIAKTKRARSPYYTDDVRAKILASTEDSAVISRALGVPLGVVCKVRDGTRWSAAEAPGSSAFNWRP